MFFTCPLLSSCLFPLRTGELIFPASASSCLFPSPCHPLPLHYGKCLVTGHLCSCLITFWFIPPLQPKTRECWFFPKSPAGLTLALSVEDSEPRHRPKQVLIFSPHCPADSVVCPFLWVAACPSLMTEGLPLHLQHSLSALTVALFRMYTLYFLPHREHPEFRKYFSCHCYYLWLQCLVQSEYSINVELMLYF